MEFFACFRAMTLKKICLTLTLATLVTVAHAEIGNKRIPSGFLGMRGKKSVDYGNFDDALDRVSWFDPMDEAKLANLENALLDRSQDAYYGYQDHIGSFKRAPMGFQGMRGKKNYLMNTEPFEDTFDDEYLEKRAPNLGFQGMRGKREFEYSPYLYSDKRAPLGFQGMRGKKSVDDLKKPEDAEIKTEKVTSISQEQPINGYDMGSSDGMVSMKQRRAQSVGFYGVRGKKMPSVSSFFGMRGKKGPYDYQFRGKFVGVRGKKMYEGRPSELQMLADKLAWNGDSYEKRKGPSGFVGMRGKKWISPG